MIHTRITHLLPQQVRILFAGVVLVLAQSLVATAQTIPQSFADLAEQISPSVVNITTKTAMPKPDTPQGVVPKGSPFEDFFRDLPNRRGGARPSSALGSGFVISADGYIVTNNHVIEQADEIMVEFYSGVELPAEIIGTDKNTDIALLKVETDEPLPFVPFGDSDTARVGDWVVAVGNPLGQGFSVSAGIVSARNRALSGAYDDYIQTDAAINKGNSGGPLFNVQGEVIGVNTAILSPTGGSIGIGFAMASNVVSHVAGQLQEYGETRRGWLGVNIQDITQDIADSIDGLNTTAGALVTNVPEGPAKDAGILVGDVIVTFDGTAIGDVRELIQVVGLTAVGKQVDVVVLRAGQQKTVSVTLGLRDDEKIAAAREQANPEGPVPFQDLGIILANLSDEIRQGLNLPDDAQGVVVVDVDQASDAYAKGLRSGDVIAEAGQTKLTSVQDMTAQIEAARGAGRKSLLLLVRRDGNPRFVALGLD